MRRFSFHHWLLLAIGMVFLFFILSSLFKKFVLGYPSSSVPNVVAQWIVKGDRDPHLCFKMPDNVLPFLPVTLFPAMGPTIGSKRSLCVYKVAQIKKDPSVCELLMPSRYGLDCALGAMKEQ